MTKYTIKASPRKREVFANNIEELQNAILTNPFFFLKVDIIDNSSLLFKDDSTVPTPINNPFFK